METDGKKNYSEKLSDAIETNVVARTLSFDLEKSVETLLLAAARSLQADGASIIVRDAGKDHLVFLKAVGQVSDQLEGIEIPAGKGIAGFVAMSGQPMAISDVGQEESFYAEIDKKTGFSTEILLATPLFFDGEVIGVLEFINRTGDPPFAPFSPEEMDNAAVYGEAVGALVNALQASRLSSELAAQICEAAEDLKIEEIREWVDQLLGKREHKELLDLAVLVKEIAERGSASRSLCREVLESILKFTNQEDSPDYSDV